MTRRLVLLMAIPSGSPVSAEAKNLHWKDLPQYRDKKQVTVTDGQGVTHTGWFIATYADAIVLGSGGRIEVPRASVLSITVHITRPNHVERFGNHMISFAFSPVAIVTFPVAIVVYLGGAPICALLDNIERHRSKEVTIKLLPDPK